MVAGKSVERRIIQPCAHHAQVFGNSPDETAHCRLSLNKESVQEAVVMIQPSLQSYAFPPEGAPIEPEPVRPCLLVLWYTVF